MNIQASSQFTRHPNADAITAFVNDTTLPVFYWHRDRAEWVKTDKPNWNPHIPHYTGHTPPIAPPRPLIDFHGYEIQEPYPVGTILTGTGFVFCVILGIKRSFEVETLRGAEVQVYTPFYHPSREAAQLHAVALNALCGVPNV